MQRPAGKLADFDAVLRLAAFDGQARFEVGDFLILHVVAEQKAPDR